MPPNRVNNVFSTIPVGSILLANLFLFLPLTLYMGNDKEFTVSINSILLTYVGPALGLLALMALISFALPTRLYKYFLTTLALISLLIWLQGNLFVWEYGLLNGSSIDWLLNQRKGWFELIFWFGAIALVVWKVDKIGKSVVGIALTLGVLQFCIFSYQYFRATTEINKEININTETIAEQKIHQFSQTSNIVHIVADGFQADILDEILSNAITGKQLSEELSGFTFFRQQLGIFPYTHMTVPAILSGQVYRNQLPIDDFMSSALGKDSVIGLAKNNGYEIDMAIPRGTLLDIYGNTQPDYLLPLNSSGRLTHDDFVQADATRLFDLSLFRAVPHQLKKRVYNDQNWFTQSLNPTRPTISLQNFTHMQFLEGFKEKISTKRDTPVYKLFHLMLSHNPMVTSSECHYAGGILLTTRESVLAQSFCSLKSIVLFLQAMKIAGVYDSSTIIIMGDHGAWVPPRDLKRSKDTNGDKKLNRMNPAMVALATPFLAIKPPDESGPIKFNQAPTSITDTAFTIADINNFDNNLPGYSTFDIPEDSQRSRRFMFYQYKKSEWTDNHLSQIEEFSIDGDAVDDSAWTRIKTHLPGGKIQSAEAN